MKDVNKVKKAKFFRRQRRTRAKMIGTATKPRMSVFRSLLHIYVQAIDDVNSLTLAAASDKDIKEKGKKADIAAKVGETFGKKLADKKITEGIFDKGAYKYHGRVKALADGIRKSGINF
ncbi:50S ribosomal protein L18 [bacterium]|jgi:large subunit ribosomal protein L18|nr:50S ribosomal protein L18 [bacterium]MBT4649514.1 50S ribosomal protein L18 [bacterium]